MADWRTRTPDPSPAYVPRLPSAYVASLCGFCPEMTMPAYRRELLPRIRGAGFAVVDPWVLTDIHKIQHVASLPYGKRKRREWAKLNGEIAANNERGLISADVVVAYVGGLDIDPGTSWELGYATALGKPAFLYRDDFRQAGDNEGARINLQVEYSAYRHGGAFVTTLNDLFGALYNWRMNVWEPSMKVIH